MSWLTSFVRPKFKSLVRNTKDVPDHMWRKCKGCEHMLFHKDIKAYLYVCPRCGFHMRMPLKNRLDMLFDGGSYERLELPSIPQDPLGFKDKKRYTERLKEARTTTGEEDAVVACHGPLEGRQVVVAAFNFAFMAGSMGVSVGEGLITAVQFACRHHLPLLMIPASGGARMQEGTLSLMQMPRTVAALQELKELPLPVIVLLTDPTTGGVSASFAMLGDIHMAEPGSMIGFAGPRVIAQTVREVLPEGFQRAQYLYEHGMVDMIVERHKLKETISVLFNLLMERDLGGGKVRSEVLLQEEK